MCRYAESNYPQHYACLPCRMAFKGDFDISPATPRSCPSCGQVATIMGRDFKPPRKLAHAQWRKLELLVANGVSFDSCGCTGPGLRPRTLSDTKRFVTDRSRRQASLPLTARHLSPSSR